MISSRFLNLSSSKVRIPSKISGAISQFLGPSAWKCEETNDNIAQAGVFLASVSESISIEKRYFSVQASSRNHKKVPKWPLGENSASRRKRFGENVEKAKAEAKKRIKFAAKGIPPRPLEAPENGLLVPGLIPVAHKTLAARAAVKAGVERLMEKQKAFTCSFCSEKFIGSEGHSMNTCTGKEMHTRSGKHLWLPATSVDILGEMEVCHLVDRMTTLIQHIQRFEVPRLPAVVELCIQAGVEVPDYPTVRRTVAVNFRRPTYEDGVNQRKGPKFEPNAPREWTVEERLNEAPWDNGDSVDQSSSVSSGLDDLSLEVVSSVEDNPERNIKTISKSDRAVNGVEPGFPNCPEVDNHEAGKGDSAAWPWNIEMGIDGLLPPISEDPDMKRVAERTLKAFRWMREGVVKLMSKYPVKTCGYCQEVHVGPRGHKIRLCDGPKHQWRHGQHGWQEAIIDDVLPPQYVYHLRDDMPLLSKLKSYYGMAPAIVELCVQAGANIPSCYLMTMRTDVVVPDVEEVENVV